MHAFSHTSAASTLITLGLVDVDKVNAIAAEAKIQAGPVDEMLDGALRAAGIRGQSDLTKFLLTQKIVPTADQLTTIFTAAFPTAKISPRHGGHFLCLARTGKLGDLGVAVPKAVRKPKAASTTTETLVKTKEATPAPAPEPVKVYTAEELNAMERPALLAVATDRGVSAKGKNAAIIERILAEQSAN